MNPFDINEYIQSLKASKQLGDQVVYHGCLPEKPTQTADVDNQWPQLITAALKEAGIDRLYSHQAAAADLIRSGRHTVVATPTASGKSLIYNLPVLEKIISEPDARALYLFPLKALAQDQLKAFNGLAGLMGLPSPAAVYDGDTSAHHRKKIRTQLPNVILTNPEMVHLSMLPHHELWVDFFSSLRFVVVDEVHTYRGVMGSHMAQVFRRLKRICAHYGAYPTFVFCSATISNPGDLCRRLTGLEIAEINESGAPQGNRHMIFIDPVQGASQAAISLLKAALHRGLRTIVYTQSRKMTELISIWVQNRSGEFAGRISAYRAGFLPEERRTIEAKLASGELLAVISTSALELGIDVGDLDLCILVGYPGTVISTLQRGGRVGRTGQDSATILIAGEDALDQYFMRHPEHLINSEPEAAVINPFNPGIAKRHLVCAAAELPLQAGDPLMREGENRVLVQALEEKGELLRSGDGNTWFSNRKRPHREVDLRGSGESYIIVNQITGEVIGEIDGFRAFKETHPGAVYLHMGETFVVNTLDIASRTIRASASKVDFYTRAVSHKETEILEVYNEKKVWNTTVCTGRVKVTEQVLGYEKWTIHGKKRLNRIELDLPPMVFESDGIWFKIPPESALAAEEAFLHFMGGIHALEHAAIGIFPLLVLADRNDLGGISTPFHPQINGPAVFIFDAAAGGAGLVHHAFHKVDRLLTHTLNIIRECPCENGCPSCVHSPKCGSGNRPIDKAAAIFVLNHMMDAQKTKKEDHPTLISDKVRPIVPPIREMETMIRPVALPVALSVSECGNSLSASAEEPAGLIKRSGRKSIQRIRMKRSRIRIVSVKGLHPPVPSARPYQWRYGVLDIETQKSADEVGGWHRADLMRASCVILYDSGTDEYLEFLEDRIPELLECLTGFDMLVGFNVKRFDYKVLSGYTNFDFSSLNTLDILEEVHRHLGYRLSLDHLAASTLGTAKCGNGLQALLWWKEGKIQEIIDYCRKDVEITRYLFEFGAKNGYLLFTNKAKCSVRIPVKWQSLFPAPPG